MDIRQQMINTKLEINEDYEEYLRVSRDNYSKDTGHYRALDKAIKETQELRKKITESKNNTDVMEKIYKEMPVLPIEKNTQGYGKVGFRNESQLKISSSLSKELKNYDKYISTTPTQKVLQLKAVRDAWNGLSDDDRNQISSLNISSVKKSNYSVGGVNAGSYNSGTGELEIYIHSSVGMNRTDHIYNTIQHELAHAKFDNIKKESPDKISKFTNTISSDEIRNYPLNDYVASFSNPEKNIDNAWKAKEKRMKKSMAFTKDEIKKAKKDFYANENVQNWSKEIYANETHSAITELIAGTKTVKDVNPRLKQYFKSL